MNPNHKRSYNKLCPGIECGLFIEGVLQREYKREIQSKEKQQTVQMVANLLKL